jgi:hypothetical protein
MLTTLGSMLTLTPCRAAQLEQLVLGFLLPRGCKAGRFQGPAPAGSKGQPQQPTPLAVTTAPSPAQTAISPLDLPYISPTSPLHLAYISCPIAGADCCCHVVASILLSFAVIQKWHYVTAWYVFAFFR